MFRTSMDEGASTALMRFLGRWAEENRLDHVYVVGGAPRNFLMGLPIKDLDLVVDSVALGKDSEWVAKLLMLDIPAEVNLATNNYGVAILTVKTDWWLGDYNLKGENIEIANAREESYTGAGGKGYKPSEVTPVGIREDVKRREFRVNTLLWKLLDLAKGPDRAEILDLTGCGISDLKAGVLHCPSDPDVTFKDDPTRIIRAVKFYVKYGLKPDSETEQSIRRNVQAIKKAPPSAIADILINTILSGSVQQNRKALHEMKRLGILDVVSDIAKSVPSFRQTLARWSNNQRLEILFEMLDFGVPIDDRVRFLTPVQQKRFREKRVENPEQFLDVLKQPGKVVDFPYLIDKLGLPPHQIPKLTARARDLLLEGSSVPNSLVLTKLLESEFR